MQRPVLQQLGLRDMAVRHLADIGVPLGRLSIAFARPAHLGQTLSLVLQGSRFELQDDRRRLVAYGQAGEGSAGSEPLGGL